MAWEDGLEGVHYDIAADENTSIRVLAGPGTGKTYAMMRRVARLLESGVPPDRILTVSFTRTAARDLKEQLLRLGIHERDVNACTLHSFCYGILAREEAFTALGRNPRPLLSFEQKQLVNDLARNHGGINNVKRLIKAYEAGWAKLQRDHITPPVNPEEVAFEADLIDWLVYHKCMLIGELVPMTLSLIRQNPALDILPNYEHVLVDEYQDLNKADQALVKELAGNGSLLIVGDDNQSIYSFRYANPEAIIAFPDENPLTVEYEIEECRRCPPNIVNMSNSLIGNNQPLLETRRNPLRPIMGQPLAEVYIVQHSNTYEEITTVSEYIYKYLERNDHILPGQVLVLATRRFLGHGIQSELINRGLNALCYFYEDELKNQSAAEGFCLLSLLVNPDDRASLRAWLGMGNTTNGFSVGYGRVKEYSRLNNQSIIETLEQIISNEIQISYCRDIANRYSLLKEKIRVVSELRGLDLVRELWPLGDENSNDIRHLAEAKALSNPEPESIHQELLKEITQPELPGSNDDIIRIMSLHKSKGLTASLVVIVGCMSGTLPLIKDDEEEVVKEAIREEQRRLFYVAITRATKTLIISSSTSLPLQTARTNKVSVRRTYMLGEQIIAETLASPFIAELGHAAPTPIASRRWRELCDI